MVESDDIEPLLAGRQSVRVGVVGAGWISTVYHLPILDYLDDATVEFVADIDDRKARHVTDTYGGQAIEVETPSELPDCDVLLLAIPVGVRDEYIEAFGDRRTAIFCEKPFAVNTSMHESFLRSADAVFCNYQRTCYEPVNQLRTIFQEGVFGELERAVVFEGLIGGADKGIGPNHYRTDLSLSGGGVLVEVGCHTLSELVHVFRDWNLSVRRADLTWNAEFDTDIDATLLASNDGREVSIEYRVSTIRNLGKGARFTFENAEVRFNPFDSETPLSFRPRGEDKKWFTLEPAEEWATTHHQGVHLRWKQFLADLRGESTRPHVRTAPEVTALLEEIYDRADRPRPLESEA
jgi:predicted dehydrogenase